MAQPQLAARTPVACAGCYGQYPRRIHIDFRSAIEGAQVDPANPRSQFVDWVVLCEKCLRAGVSLLPEEQTIKDTLEQQIADLKEELTQTQAFADKLEDALSSRPAREAPRAAKPKPAQRRNRYEPKIEAEA